MTPLDKKPPTAHEVRVLAAQEYYWAQAHRDSAEKLKADKAGSKSKAGRQLRRVFLKMARESDITHKALSIYLSQISPTSS